MRTTSTSPKRGRQLELGGIGGSAQRSSCTELSSIVAGLDLPSGSMPNQGYVTVVADDFDRGHQHR